MNSNKKIILSITALLIGALSITSCKKNFYDVVDPNGLEGEVAWNDAGAVGLFLNRGYSLMMPQWPTLAGIHNTSDELNNASTAFLYGQLTDNSITDIGTAFSITASRYADIRRCNLALQNLETSTMATTDRNLLRGQFYFLRAYTYFRLVRLYGGVPLVLRAQTLAEEDLRVPRSKTSACIEQIARDCDSAAANLPAKWTGADVGRIPRAAAKAVKGKALLYWASPQFNPTNDAQRWTDAYLANKDALTTGLADGFALLGNYANIFTTEDNAEVLLVRKYNASRDLGNNVENICRPFSETTSGSGSYQPTWNLVQAYTMNNGVPITNATSGYNAAQFWLGRDPRLNATISYNGQTWALSGKAGRRQWQYTGVLDETAGTIVTGFYCRRFCNPSTSAANAVYNSNTGGGSGMDWIEMRFAEVYANLAECALETGNMTEAKDMIRELRKRATIQLGTQDYGLALATTVADMRTLILNERQVEFALEGMRYHDLRRTRNFAQLSNRMSYKVAPKPPYFAGTGSVAGRIYLDQLNAQGFKPRDTANLDNQSVYAAMFGPPSIVSLEGTNVISIPNNYYVYPLPTLMMQTPGMEQTLGWPGGTFDPYQ